MSTQTGTEPRPELDPRAVAFARLMAIVDRLRAPDGCPWDRKQTIESMAPHLVEEAHEVLDAVDKNVDEKIAEEAGDVMMTVLLICRIAEEAGRFDLARAAHASSDKLIHRHPHVFGDVNVESAEEVLTNWEAIKKKEREGKQEDASALAGVPVSLPALQRAQRLCGKAVSAGFKWDNVAGAVAKLREEQGELDTALRASGLDRDAKAPATPAQRAAVEHELGDVMLAAAFLARYLDLDAEKLARDASHRFERRFRAMESRLPGPLANHSLPELMSAWQVAKSTE
ncbi:MAG: nucleoside triphosphate pyrophosphohydrolase [Planctomycetes bacterium]|nr:nucleoside triphosphate pyrophosphohydrolase [Planctomycetota bacterium]